MLGVAVTLTGAALAFPPAGPDRLARALDIVETAARIGDGGPPIAAWPVAAWPAAERRALEAALQAAGGDGAAAMATLALAEAAGFQDRAGLLARHALASARKASGAASGAPAAIATAIVDATTTRWSPALGLLRVDASPPGAPQDADRRWPGDDPVATRLARLIAAGAAAGLTGDLYDNRDRGHSQLRIARWPHLGVTRYAEAARRAGLDYGPNLRLAFPAPTIGNSSTALTGAPFWRSQPRAIMTRPGALTALHRLYAANHLYVYPEHRDHDRAHGDLFPANTPYMLISQGSSGSDRPILRALLTLLAGLPPRTKARLRAEGLIAPTLQMLLRRSLPGVEDARDYLSAAAHPTVFDADALDPARLLDLAQTLTPDAIPPLATLRVLEERAPGPPPDRFADMAAERLFDAPAAVARIALGPAPTRTYILRADARDPNNRPLRFQWQVLRGQDVRIETLDASGRTVRLTAPWQTLSDVPGAAGLRSARIDVALFADNGATYSAPAFFSVSFPQDSQRRFDADGRILSIDYRRRATPDAYVDPVLAPLRLWRDTYRYDANGALTGWVRHHDDGSVTAYSRLGHRILTRDAQGRPVLAETVAYTRGAPVDALGPDLGRTMILDRDVADRVRYIYIGPEDSTGEITPVR